MKQQLSDGLSNPLAYLPGLRQSFGLTQPRISLTFFSFFFIIFIMCFFFYFIFKLYIIVLVLPNIKMNPPQVYVCSPWTPQPVVHVSL